MTADIRTLLNLFEAFDFGTQTYSLRKDAVRALSRRGLNPAEYDIVPTEGGRFKITSKSPETAEGVADKIEQLQELPQTPDIRALLDRLEKLEARLTANEQEYATRRESDTYRAHEYMHPTLNAMSKSLRQYIKNGDSVDPNTFSIVLNRSGRSRSIKIGDQFTMQGYGHKPAMCPVYIDGPITIKFSHSRNGDSVDVDTMIHWDHWDSKTHSVNFSLNITGDVEFTSDPTWVKPSWDDFDKNYEQYVQPDDGVSSIAQQRRRKDFYRMRDDYDNLRAPITMRIINASNIIDAIVKEFSKRYVHNIKSDEDPFNPKRWY